MEVGLTQRDAAIGTLFILHQLCKASEILESQLVLFQLEEKVSSLNQGLSLLGLVGLNYLGVRVNGSFEFTHAPQAVSEAEVSERVPRLSRKHVRKILYGFVELLLKQVDLPPGDVGLGVIRVLLDRSSQSFYGTWKVVCAPIRNGENNKHSFTIVSAYFGELFKVKDCLFRLILVQTCHRAEK